MTLFMIYKPPSSTTPNFIKPIGFRSCILPKPASLVLSSRYLEDAWVEEDHQSPLEFQPFSESGWIQRLPDGQRQQHGQ